MMGLLKLVAGVVFAIGCCAAGNFTEAPDKARIIGGIPTIPGEIKYQLSVRYRGLHHCGGSLITVDGVQVALTAAHCISKFLPQDVSVVAGDYRLSDRSGTEQERRVLNMITHEKFTYNLSVLAYDIGLLFLNEPFAINQYILPVPLPLPFQDTKGRVLVSGWGVYNEAGFISDNLTKLEVPIVDFQTCKLAYGALIKEFFAHFMCTASPLNKDTCKGDSGGPVVSIENRSLAGIISWGAGCGNPLYPGVNTRVSSFVEWINEQVKKQRGGESQDEDDSDEDNAR